MVSFPEAHPQTYFESASRLPAYLVGITMRARVRSQAYPEARVFDFHSAYAPELADRRFDIWVLQLEALIRILRPTPTARLAR